MNKCSFMINIFPHLAMTALLNTVVCSKFVFQLADFCSIGAAIEGYFRTDNTSKILLLSKLLFLIEVFELAISADYHPTSVMIVQGGYFLLFRDSG